MALNLFVGSETIVRLSIMLDNLVAKCFNLFGMFGNVWNELSVWQKKKKPSGFNGLRLGGAARKKKDRVRESRSHVVYVCDHRSPIIDAGNTSSQGHASI